MLGGAFNKRACPIGLDVGAHVVRMMQLERVPAGGFKATAASTAVMPADLAFDSEEYHQAVTEAIAKAYEAGGFSGRTVVSGLPASGVQYKNLRLPKMPASELQAAVEWEASDRLQLAAEPYSIQYFDAGEVRQGEDVRQEVILLASPTRFVERHVKTLTDCDLQPMAVDVVPGALARCILATSCEDDDNAGVAIDIGYAATKVLITRGEQILFFKLIDIGGRKFDQTVAKHLSLPEAEVAELRRQMPSGSGEMKEHVRRAMHEAMRPIINELGREIGLCLRYYSVTFRGRRPESALLIGGEASQPGLAALLSEQAGVDIRAGNPLEGVDIAPVKSTVAETGESAWAVAAGLSMRPEPRRGSPRRVAQEVATCTK